MRVGLTAALTGGAIAVSTVPALASGSDPRAVAVLEAAASAAHERGYVGTQYVSVFSSGSTSSVVLQVAHTPGHGTVVNVASGATDTPAVYSSDATLSGGLAVVGLDGGALRLLQQTYDLELEPTPATEPAQVVARRQDGHIAARFWVDRPTGLLSRREVYDLQGRVVRASAFVDLRLVSTAPTTAASVRYPVADIGERRLDASGLSALREQGWSVPSVLPGQLLLYDARMQSLDGADVVHLSYSDGLSTVSVFQQRGGLDRSAVEGWHRQRVEGADVWWQQDAVPARAIWSAKGRVWTLVADAPGAAAERVVASLPHERAPHRGFWSRLGHGLARLGSWLNPFG